MYVADLFAHCVQEFMFVAFLWQVVNFDRIRIRRQPPNQPVSDHALKRIMRPDGGGDRSFVVSFPASSLPFFPDRRRRHSSFCLPPEYPPWCIVIATKRRWPRLPMPALRRTTL